MKAIDLLRLQTLVRRFRSKGHQIATLDPLLHKVEDAGTSSVRHWRVDEKARRLAQMMATAEDGCEGNIDLSVSGFSPAVTEDSVVPEDALNEIVGPHWRQIDHPGSSDLFTVGHILRAMQRAYCGNVSAEFVHVQTAEQFEWLSSHLECFRAKQGGTT